MKYNGYEYDIPKRLKQLREQHGFTQPALARMVNDQNPGWTWHQTTVAKIESGERALKVEDLLAISDIYWMSLDELLVDLEALGDREGANDAEKRFAQQYSERRAFMGDLAEQTKVIAKVWEIDRHRERILELEREIKELRG